MVMAKFSDSFADPWQEAEADNVLMCIGNHDAAIGDGTLATQEQLYEKFFEPYIANTGITISENKTFWYKNYVGYKIVAVDCMIQDTEALNEQFLWLENQLTDALDNNKAVIILEHYPPYNAQRVNTVFDERDIVHDTSGNVEINRLLEGYQSRVQNFINNGGNFVCYLCGHNHRDYFHFNENYPSQLFVGVNKAYADNKFSRIGQRDYDCANIVVVDPVRFLLKIIRVGLNVDRYMQQKNVLCINYKTKEIIAQG
jgi:hypothetical protein